MKKTFSSFIAILLVFTVLFSANSTAAYAKGEPDGPIYTVTDVLGGIVDGAIKLLGLLCPTPDYPTVEEYFSSES
ncbi:MAG: hypothetical protein IJB16_00375, partial [Clostridia bacterium]|nr:hypothetical protein [Clostridia bacterium]